MTRRQSSVQARNEKPDIAALGNLGDALRKQGNPEAALDCYKKILHAIPNCPEAYYCMAACWYQMYNLPEAELCLEKALRQRPDYVAALSDLGTVLRNMGRSAEARAKFEHALRVEPNNALIITKLGGLLYAEGKVAEARTKFEHAFQIEPSNALVISTLGSMQMANGKVAEGLDYYNQALASAPQCEEALWGKSLAQLALGEYREGWELYGITGLGNHHMRGPVRFVYKPWDGNPAPSKHLLIWHEQGLGDSLQFIRYAELCKQRVGKVSVLCQKPLVRLFKALAFIDDAFDQPNAEGFDEHVMMMNLPHCFATVLEAVPATVPYLKVDPEIQAKWTVKFADVADFKVGLVWAGGIRESDVNATLIDRQRSISLERMKPWLDLQGARFYNLQLDKPREQIASLGVTDRLTDFMGEVADFADTAAIVENLDLVITVDTAVAHLAGGLGKPVWILSRYNACWRWLQNRPTSPWYPTARIFGQPAMGDWDSVMVEVERELAAEIAKHGGQYSVT